MLGPTAREVLDLMTELGALHKGHFKLSSGLHSDTYFQCARILQFPDLARGLGAAMASRFDDNNFDLVVSPAMGGILIGHEVARALGRRFIFTERVEGVMTIRRGFEIQQREKVLIAEDVVTRGTSVNEVIACVEQAGGVVTGLSSIIDRTADDVDLPLLLQALAKVTVETFDPNDFP